MNSSSPLSKDEDMAKQAQAQHAPLSVAPPSAPPRPIAPGDKHRILIVEDNESSAKGLQDWINDLIGVGRWTVLDDSAASHDQALELLHDNPDIRLAFVDIRLSHSKEGESEPDESSYAVTGPLVVKSIKEVAVSQNRVIGVVGMSAHPGPHHLRAMIESGIDAYFDKDRPDTLAHILDIRRDVESRLKKDKAGSNPRIPFRCSNNMQTACDAVRNAVCLNEEERMICRLIREHKTKAMDPIALTIKKHLKTARNRVNSLAKKVGVQDYLDLPAWAEASGYLHPER